MPPRPCLQAELRRTEARELFDRMDKNSSGFVDYGEFFAMFDKMVRSCVRMCVHI